MPSTLSETTEITTAEQTTGKQTESSTAAQTTIEAQTTEITTTPEEAKPIFTTGECHNCCNLGNSSFPLLNSRSEISLILP